MSCCEEMEAAASELKALFEGLNSGNAYMVAYVTALVGAGIVTVV